MNRLFTVLFVVRLAWPAVAQAPDDRLPPAVAALDAAVARFRQTGAPPEPADLAVPEQALTEAATAASSRGNWKQAARAFTELNRLERMLGRWDLAIAAANSGIEAARKARDAEYEARALLGRAKVELSRKDAGRAGADVEAGLRAAAHSADPKLRFDLLSQQAAVQVELDQTNAADATLSTALNLSGLTDEQLVYGYLARGDIYFRISYRCDQEPIFDVCLDALKRSGDAYRRAFEAARRLGWPGLQSLAREQSATAASRAQLIAGMGKASQAIGGVSFRPGVASDVLVSESFAPPALSPQQLQVLQRANDEVHKQDQLHALASTTRSLHTDGLVRQAQGDHAGALALFLRALEAAEQEQSTLPDDQSRMAFFAEYFPVYLSAAEELLDARRFPEAFAVLEKSRARAMAELLAGRRLQVGGSKEQSLYGEAIRLDREIAAKLSARFQTVGQGGETRALDADIARLRQERQKLLRRIGAEAPRLQTLTSAGSIDLSGLQALAKADSCEVLEYLVTGTNVFVLYVSATEIRAKNVFLPRIALAQSIKEILDQVALDVKPTSQFDHTRARELYLQLVQPVRSFIHGDRLLILPHDLLTALPFELLEDPSDGTPVGERFQLSYAPSATTYAGLRRWSAGGSNKLVAAGNPEFERTAHEVERVSAVYHARPTWPTDVLVTKRQLEQRFPSAAVVHVSVHGRFNLHEPLLSYIALAPDGADNGQLTAAEIFGLPLAKTRLVVLSACESGRTEASVANEELGIVRALLYAGAGSILVSRWRVDAAATAAWMETFHRKSQTLPLAEAAREAMHAMRADPGHDHPYYWAAFSLVGR
jgi:CHAT domain-containing protein